MKAAQKLLGVPTIGGGECPGRGWWWRELKETNKPPCWSKYTKAGQKRAVSRTFLAKKSPKRSFFTQKYFIVESLQSHFILPMSHWSSGLPVCFPSQGTQVQIPWGVLMWNRDSPVSDVSLHWWPRRDWSSLWPRLRRPRPEPSLGPRADNVIIPLDLTQLSCPGFTLTAGLPSGFTTDGVGCWRGALWRACNLTSFSPCLTGPVDYLFASCHKGPGSNPLGGT